MTNIRKYIKIEPEKGRTEAYRNYIADNESQGRVITISRAAYDMLLRLVSGTNGDQLLGDLVYATGEPWPHKRYPNPKKLVCESLVDYSNSSILKQFAVFEAFFNSLVVDAVQFCEHIRSLEVFTHDHDEISIAKRRCGQCTALAERFCKTLGDGVESKLEEFVLLLDGDAESMKYIFKLLKYFRLSRNRIIHKLGLVNEELSEISSSDVIKCAVDKWYSTCRKRGPTIPSFKKGDRVRFHVTDAVFLQGISYRIASKLNELVCSKMNESDFMQMSVFYALIAEDHSYRDINFRAPEKAVSKYSTRYFRFQGPSRNLIQPLRDFGLWTTVVEKYNEKYSN